jgi:hypothetical protein
MKSKITITPKTGKRASGPSKAKAVAGPAMKHAHKGLKMIPNAGIKAQGTLMATGKKVPAAKGSDRSKATVKANGSKAPMKAPKSLNKFNNRKYEAMRKDVFGLAKKEDSGKI